MLVMWCPRHSFEPTDAQFGEVIPSRCRGHGRRHLAVRGRLSVFAQVLLIAVVAMSWRSGSLLGKREVNGVLGDQGGDDSSSSVFFVEAFVLTSTKPTKPSTCHSSSCCRASLSHCVPSLHQCDAHITGSHQQTLSSNRGQTLRLFSAAAIFDNDDARDVVTNDTSVVNITPMVHANDEATTSESLAKTSIPSYTTLLQFLATTACIWLSEPLLSLVDTTLVGVGSTTLQLAALGPATTLYDSLLYVWYFLSMATTSKLAKQLASIPKDATATTNQKNEDLQQAKREHSRKLSKYYRGLQQTTSHVVGVALGLGILTTWLCCFGGGPMILQHMVGASSASNKLLHYAADYVTIRGSVAVSSVVGMVLQSVCLVTLDTKTPAIAVMVASILNVIGDFALIRAGYGIRGAAIATAVSSCASSVVLWRAVRKRMRTWRSLEEQHAKGAGIVVEDTGAVEVEGVIEDTSNDTSTEIPQSTSDVSSIKHPIAMASLPDRRSFLELLRLSGPLFFVIVAKVACYGAMTLRCTNFGVLPLAAHNIMMRVFFFYATFGDALSQTAQSFLPLTLYPKANQTAFWKLLKRMLSIGWATALANGFLVVFILKYLGKYLASDAGIVKLMASHTGFLGLAVFFHPFVMLFEGAVIASREFRSLVTTYIVTLGLHFGILTKFTGSFPAIWRTFFIFQVLRFSNFGFHVLRKQLSSAIQVETERKTS